MKRRMITKLMATVAFAGDFGDPEYTNDAERTCELDVDRAADELRQAGYEVTQLPDRLGGHLAHPLDDFIEAHIEGPDDPKVIHAIMDEVNAIVERYGGLCFECGPIGPDHMSFADSFKDIGRD